MATFRTTNLKGGREEKVEKEMWMKQDKCTYFQNSKVEKEEKEYIRKEYNNRSVTNLQSTDIN